MNSIKEGGFLQPDHQSQLSSILVHNHPSGNPEPSQADRLISERLEKALSTVEVRLLDHVIVGHEGTCSFAERGLINNGLH